MLLARTPPSPSPPGAPCCVGCSARHHKLVKRALSVRLAERNRGRSGRSNGNGNGNNDDVDWNAPRATSSSSSSFSSSSSSSSSLGADDDADPLARLASLLAVADDPSAPQADVDAAEERATALALELSTATAAEMATTSGDDAAAAAASSSPPPSSSSSSSSRSRNSLLLRGFGRAALPPRRPYSLADLRLARVEPSLVLSPVDATLDSVRDRATLAATAGAVAAAAAIHPTFAQGVGCAGLLFFLATLDAVAAGGGVGFLILDSAARFISPTYARRVAAHEAGHFLVAYLLGLLPRGYDLSSLGAFSRSRALGVQAGTRLCDVAFRREVSTGRISSSSVDRAAAVALAGVAAEYCMFKKDGKNSSKDKTNDDDDDEGIGESAEGGVGDIRQLDALLSALGFSQAKADSTVRYALLVAVTLLRRHRGAHAALSETMLRGGSVVECVSAVERELSYVADDEI